MSILCGLTPDLIDRGWPMVVEYIQVACETTRGRWKPQDIYERCKSGDMQFWMAAKDDEILAIAVTEIINYPGKKVCCVMMVCGGDREQWQCHMSKIEAWAKSNGCQSIEAIARKGWARLMKDWDFTHVFIEKELTDG